MGAIQSGYRGHRTRKEVQQRKLDKEMKEHETIKENVIEEEIDIDLDDPEVGDAALKIQAGFKGHQARKQVKEMKETNDNKKEAEEEEEEEIDIDLDDPEVGEAALKIQA